jgi:riboflavin kinase/FMN adenylyltransferase
MVIAATGFFDGVHRGHRAVLSALCRQAEKERAKGMVITFWPHPRTVLQNDAAKFRLLNSLEEKKELILECGIDYVHLLPFTRAFSLMSTKTFFTDCLQSQYGITHLVVGYDHRIGHDTHRNIGHLEAVAHETGIHVIRVKEALCDGKVVSSTKIREAIHTGDMELANRWLGYTYALHGVVVEGNRIGRTIGFPTANMRLYEPLKQLPANGVYVVEVVQMGRRYRGMMNIGFRPTIKGACERVIETHIFDFDADIYGLPITVHPLHRLRTEREFVSLAALAQQLARDKSDAEAWLEKSAKKLV